MKQGRMLLARSTSLRPLDWPVPHQQAVEFLAKLRGSRQQRCED